MAVIRLFSTYGVKFILVATLASVDAAELWLVCCFGVFVLVLVEVAVDYYDMYNRLCRNDVFAKSTGVETVCERINRGIQVNDDDEEEEETEEIWLAVATAAVVVV